MTLHIEETKSEERRAGTIRGKDTKGRQDSVEKNQRRPATYLVYNTSQTSEGQRDKFMSHSRVLCTTPGSALLATSDPKLPLH